MGSDGPHSNSKPPRNASLGVAFLRKDGYAGMSGNGNVTTVGLLVTGARLILTADMIGPGGLVRVGVRNTAPHGSAVAGFFDGLAPLDCVPIRANVTDAVVAFAGGKALETLVGREVVLVIQVQQATVYTGGFAAD